MKPMEINTASQRTFDKKDALILHWKSSSHYFRERLEYALSTTVAGLRKELAEAKAENKARLIYGAKMWDENQELKRDIADLKKKRS